MHFRQSLQSYLGYKSTDLEFQNSIIYGRNIVEEGAVDLIWIGWLRDSYTNLTTPLAYALASTIRRRAHIIFRKAFIKYLILL